MFLPHTVLEDPDYILGSLPCLANTMLRQDKNLTTLLE